MLIKITPDKERAESMLNMAKSLESSLNEIIKKLGIGENQNLIAREYYEIIRELATAVLFIDGFKIIGEYAHKETINHLSKHWEFLKDEIMDIQDLRIRRNKSSYEGKPIKSPYLENKKQKLDFIIKKLKAFLAERLK